MALTELQLPEKAEFYNDIRITASDVKAMGLRWKAISEFIADVEAADLDAMQVPAGQIRTDLAGFRTALDAVVATIEAQAAALDKVRRMRVI